MLFHLTMTHDVDNRAGYHDELRTKLVEALGRMKELEKEAGIKVYQFLSGAPEHVLFALVEADSLGPITRWFMEIPMKQDVKVTAVQPVGEVVEIVEKARGRFKKRRS